MHNVNNKLFNEKHCDYGGKERMKCYKCKANYYEGYEYSVSECMLSSESDNVRTDYGCKLRSKTIDRLLEEELKGLEELLRKGML